MKRKNKIIIFCYGDSNNPAVWSNVPYLLTTEFEKNDCEIKRINIKTKQNIFTYIYTLFFKLFKPNSTFYFYRSNINRKIVEKKIKKAVAKYDDWADFYISISYDFSPSKYTSKDVILISDWPIEYAIEKRYDRQPDFFEKKDIARHKKILDEATFKISLFKDVTEYMNKNYRGETYYLGGLLNAFVSCDDFDSTENRKYITFIGKKSYINSAFQIIKAFQTLKDQKNIELHIIGMIKKDIKGFYNKNIFFHGYLDKGNPEQREQYYDILKKSIVIVNTNEKWAGMSSILESMYYYRPIITSKYKEFVKTFSSNIDFGYYSSNEYKDIADKINNIISLSNDDYRIMINNAHNHVKNFTYKNYIDKILKLVNDHKLK